MTLVADHTALDVLCPMHLVLSGSGHILHAGPTLDRIHPDGTLVGKRFFEVFEVKRPKALGSMQELRAAARQKLHLKLRTPPLTSLKAVAVAADANGQHIIVNFGFGISILDGVRDFALTHADFAATDLAIEMLYLVEAKTAAMEASYRLNARLQGAKNAAEEQALTDTLTGLKNRRALGAILARLVARDRPFAVMQIDLDYFKAVNDTLGHAAGDFVLQNVARIMAEETRADDVVARVGGDEFTVVLPEVESEEILRKIGQRIIDRLEEPMDFQGHECRISASIGTVWLRGNEDRSVDDMLADADVALYASKKAGRAMQTFYVPALRQEMDPDGHQRQRRKHNKNNDCTQSV